MQERKKIKVNMYLYVDQIRKLKELSAKSGAPFAELIRRAIDLSLEREKQEKEKDQ